MKKIIIVLVLFLCLCGCKTATNSLPPKTVEEELKEVIATNNYIIVDVRTKEEYMEKHVVGSINIPYDSIAESTELDKNKTIIVYC